MVAVLEVAFEVAVTKVVMSNLEITAEKLVFFTACFYFILGMVVLKLPCLQVNCISH